MKKEINLTGRVFMPLIIGQRASVVVGDKVTFTSAVEAVHKTSKKRVVFETRNSIYDVTLRRPEKTNRLRSFCAAIVSKAFG